MDFSRLRTGEIVAGIGGLALFPFLFIDWFGLGGPGPGGFEGESVGISGWDALSDLPGFLIMLAGFSGIALAALTATGRRLNIPIRRGGVTATLGVLAVLLVLWRMVAGSPGLKVGVFLGLAAVTAVAVGALLTLREDGFELLVAVAGARTRAAAAASAPAATPARRPPTAPSGGTATKSRSSRGTATKSRSGGRKSTAKKPAAKRGTASRSKSSGSARSKSSGSTRSKSSASSRSKTSGSSRAKSSGSRSRSKSSGSRSKSSGTRKRSSGGRK